ncbi:putative lactose permease [Meredithblackwellia eburnea MCA 4105]
MTAGLSFKNLANNTHESWWKDPGLRAQVLRVIILYLAVFSLGYDGSLLNGLQALTPWVRDFHAPAGYTLGLISASYYLPKVVTCWIVPIVADKWGRKIPILIGAVFMVAGGAMGAACHTRSQLIGSRILLGVGTATSQIAACALIPEIAHPRLRHMCGSFFNTTYYVGSILAAWITFAMVYYPGGHSAAWRIPTAIQALGPFFLFIGTFWVPESPRWLIAQGRNEEAHQILARFHANGKMDDELVLFEMKEIEAGIETSKLTHNASYSHWFNNAAGIRRFLIIILIGTASQWAGNGIVSYYLVPVLKQVGISAPPQTAGINGGLAIWNYICALSGASMVEKFGRRPLFLISLIGMFCCFTIMGGVAGGYAHTHNSHTGIAIIPFIYLFMGSYSIAFTPLCVLYTPEISPYAMRAQAAGILAFSQNAAQAFNQFANPIALAAIKWKYYFVYCAVLGVYFILFFLFVRETRGLTVEEAAVLYESADKRDAALEAEMKIRQAAEAALADKTNKGTIEHLDSDSRDGSDKV